MGEGRMHHWMSHQFIQDPMQAFGSLTTCSREPHEYRTLKASPPTTRKCFKICPNWEPSTFQPPTDWATKRSSLLLLYYKIHPLSNGRDTVCLKICILFSTSHMNSCQMQPDDFTTLTNLCVLILSLMFGLSKHEGPMFRQNNHSVITCIHCWHFH